jgi:hypothetical protein
MPLPKQTIMENWRINYHSWRVCSSPVRHNTAPTPTLHHIPHNMRMRDLATHTAARIRRLV